MILAGAGCSSCGRRRGRRANGVEREDIPIHPGHVIARPPATRIAHSFLAGDDGVTMLIYGTETPNDMCYYPRSNKISFAASA